MISRKHLIQGFLIVLAGSLLACGEDSTSEFSGDPLHDDSLLLALTSGTSDERVVTGPSFSFAGYASTGNSPDYCPVQDSNETRERTGITVTWSNQTTGESGLADQHMDFGCVMLLGCGCYHVWSAGVPLDLGDNRIQIRAVSTSGFHDSMTFRKTRITDPDLDPTRVENFIGTWLNEDPNTGGITKVAIRADAWTIFVHMWGACLPSDCDWGETTTPVSDADDNMLSIVWDQSFAIRRNRYFC